MLKPLHPGIEPIGLFDLEDSDHALVRGGEVAFLRALDASTDGYAADVFDVGPRSHLKLGDVASTGILYGLVDEGTTDGTGSHSYGTMLGTIVGGATGKGTGFGTQSSVGTVVVGPATVYGSGKATLWTKPGLYGVSVDGWENSTKFDTAGSTINDAIYGSAEDGTIDGKLTIDADGTQVAVSVGLVRDPSAVSTTITQAAAAGTDTQRYVAVYLLGVRA